MLHSRAADRAYLTGGGDVTEQDGEQFFRLDVENHGKTPAQLIAYDVRFAKLAELQAEFPTARRVRKRFPNVDGISPTGARKKIYTDVKREAAADAVYGAIWYKDIWGKGHRSRFVLRIAEKRDIEGGGLQGSTSGT
jgi:hypothetical protein